MYLNSQRGLQRERRMVTIDMAGDMKDLMDFYNQLKSNPRQFILSKFNINLPQNINMNDSNEIMQYLLNSGQRTQQQVNRVMEMKKMFKQ